MDAKETTLDNKSNRLNSPSPSQRKKAASKTASRGFCKRFGDCLVMGPAASDQRPAELNQLVRKVGEVDKELQQEKELKGMYRMRLERTQGFLKYCLQVAQDNGFLDLILNNKDKGHDQLSFSTTITRSSISPPSPYPAQFHPDLGALQHQAKMNGWYIDPQEIEIQRLSTQGSTADIYKGKWRGLDVAIKCMFPDFFHSSENGISFFAQEVETLSRQRHPFVLHLMGVSLDPPENCWIVTEFLSSNLKNWLHGPGKRQKERTIPLAPLKDRVAMALEISQAMQYLHESKPKTLHRDLKPSNIFLDDALHVRVAVADFGHARYLTDGEKALTGETGTYVYMAPEVIKCAPYDEKCDVYSFGVIINELVTGEYPYIDTEYGPSKVALEVAENRLRPSTGNPEEEMKDLTELIKLAWDQEPATRPTFAQITASLRIVMKRLSPEL